MNRTKPENIKVSDTLPFEHPPALSSLLRMPYSYEGILISGENIVLFHMPLTTMCRLGHLSGSSVPLLHAVLGSISATSTISTRCTDTYITNDS